MSAYAIRQGGLPVSGQSFDGTEGAGMLQLTVGMDGPCTRMLICTSHTSRRNAEGLSTQ